MKMHMFSYLGSILLCYKIGGGPFYFWFPSVCTSIGWWSCFLLMSLQKIIPMMLISLFIGSVLWLMSFISLVIGVMGSMNQTDMKQLMAFSSIHHIGWMLISFMVSDEFWMLYLFFYMLMMLGWMSYLESGVISDIMKSVKYENKWIILLILLNLGGVPPLMGFFLKWWSFYYFVMYEYSMLLLLLLFSVTMLYVYFRIIYDFVMGGVQLFSWKVSVDMDKLFQYDIIILMSFCLGTFMSIIFI